MWNLCLWQQLSPLVSHVPPHETWHSWLRHWWSGVAIVNGTHTHTHTETVWHIQLSDGINNEVTLKDTLLVPCRFSDIELFFLGVGFGFSVDLCTRSRRPLNSWLSRDNASVTDDASCPINTTRLQQSMTCTNIETVSCPCNTCFWYARALAVTNTSRGTVEWRTSYSQHSSVLHGQETISIFIANLHAIFNDILRKNHGTLLYCRLRQWASLSMGRVLKFSQADEIDSV